LIELAQERGKFFLLQFIEFLKNCRNTFFKLRNGALVELSAFVGEYDVNYATVGFIALACHQFLVFQPIDNAREIANCHHHLRADLTEG